MFQSHGSIQRNIFYVLAVGASLCTFLFQCHTDPKYIVQGMKPIFSPPFGNKKTKKRLGYFHLHSLSMDLIKILWTLLKYVQPTFLEDLALFYLNCLFFLHQFCWIDRCTVSSFCTVREHNNMWGTTSRSNYIYQHTIRMLSFILFLIVLKICAATKFSIHTVWH